ncbi:MAG: MFS transporter [Lachnospiraceae bacterium]|nr:MFS transporter [Candidatus Equihabitans merdae]
MFSKAKEIFREDVPWKQILLAFIFTATAYGIYKGVLDNYLAEIVGVGEFDRGVTEFFRELPGVLLIIIFAALAEFSAEFVYKIGAVVMIIGLCMISFLPPIKVMVIAAIFMYSLGEHIQLGMKNSIMLQYAKPDKGGAALGIRSSVDEIGSLIGFLIVSASLVIFSGRIAYKNFFMVAAAVMIVAMLLALRVYGTSEQDKNRRRIYLRKKYSKYYILEVFYGSRKQVFFTFGPYVLILFYGANAATISFLLAVSAVCCSLAAPFVGRIIDKVGYKAVMVSDTLLLLIVCFFYGFAHHLFPRNIALIVCCINYVLDSVISLCSMASNVYVQDLSDSTEEMRATISTGISVNHVITLAIALFGGWIWQTLGIETLFIISAFLGLCNSAIAATIKTSKQKMA